MTTATQSPTGAAPVPAADRGAMLALKPAVLIYIAAAWGLVAVLAALCLPIAWVANALSAGDQRP